jgi:hypothetical protein
LWICFGIALGGIYRKGSISLRELIGAGWNRRLAVIRDLAIAWAALLSMGVIGSLSSVLLGPLHSG